MKRWLIAIIIGVLAGGVGSGIYVWRTKYFRPVVSSINQQSNTDSTPAQQLLIWNDPAGFSFSYPQGLAVDPHPEDEENYAHLELTSSDHPGKIIVWAKDLPVGGKTLDAWVKANKTYAGATIVDSTFTGEPAKKILLATTPPSRHVVAYADDLLFVVEASLEDSAFWSGLADGVVDTFKIIPLEPASAEDSQEPADESYVGADEEEIIE